MPTASPCVKAPVDSGSQRRTASAGTVNGTRLCGLSRLRDRLSVPNLIFAATSPSAHRRAESYAENVAPNRGERLRSKGRDRCP
jgi:hypothetical protein